MKLISPRLKLRAVKEVLTDKHPVTLVSKKYGCTRQSLYSWTKIYQKNPLRALKNLQDGHRRGKKHPKSVSWKVEKLILDLTIKEPDLSLKSLLRYLSGLGYKVSSHGIYNVLLRYGLQTSELRHRFSQIHPIKTVFTPAISPANRAKVVETYLNEGKHITEICKIWNISRPTFYKWLKRYKSAVAQDSREADVVSALVRNYKRGPEHHRSAPESAKEAILETVRANPDFSVHRIHAHLPRIDGRAIAGHHAVQNILFRENLNTFEKRQRYAEGYSQVPEVTIAPLYTPEVPLYKLRHLIAHFATVPKLVFTNPKRGLPYALASLSSLVVLFLWIRLLFITPYASPLGLFFSSMALFFGLFFFIYSMKYYITVLLVLKLAQSGGRGSEKLEVISDKSRLKQAAIKILRMLGGRFAANTSTVNPLTLNLDKIELKNHPFVSIHVALYNEKRVVERLIRACESQEYYEEVSKVSNVKESLFLKNQKAEVSKGGGLAAYEVIIADDSTDETTEICKEILSTNGRILDRTRKDEEMEVYVSSPPVGSTLPVIKLIHRFSRSGFKGAALQRALENTNPKAMYISVFDADFVPYPDTIEQFVKTFQELNGSQASSGKGNEARIDEGLRQTSPNTETSFITDNRNPTIAAVQGYQWHVLNKSQTWITRGVRTEYAGSYVIERAGEEIYGGLKQIAGSVYAIRADILRQFGWGTSITEDFELTLRLYEKGYKVAFTPYIQAPAEAVSTIKRLVRQRMRWAEGASYNIKVMLPRLLFGRWEEAEKISNYSNYSNYSNQAPSTNDQIRHSDIGNSLGQLEIRSISNSDEEMPKGKVWIPSGLTKTEKLEFAYLAPYYLQAAFFVIGTFSWFISEAILGSRLPFWTAALGWSLVFTNILALPLMNIVGLFLEESDERDYIGILSFMALSYIVVPFQAYAAIKGFIETEEGPWFRTPKTGMITDTFGRSGFSKFFGNIFAPRGARAVHDTVSSSSDTVSERFAFAFQPLQGNSFRIRPRSMRYAGNLALGLVIAITVGMSMMAPFVPNTNIYAQKPIVKTLGESTLQEEEITEQTKEVELTAEGEEIGKSRLIGKKTKDGRNIEYVFSKEPVVRVKIDGYEIEFETKSIGGRDVRPRIARIYGEGQVVYEEAVSGVDIKYTINEGLITEEFILKNRQAAEAVGDKITQNIRTVGVKVVSPDPTVFGFYTDNGEELFKLTQPFAKDDDGLVTNDLSLSLEKAFDYTGGYRLTKTLGSSAQEWLKSPIRAYPVSIDPTIVTGGVDDSETTYGGLQRKLAYVSSNWYAFYNCDANPCTSTEGKNGIFYQKSANGISWDGYVNVNSSDTDDFSPSISVSGTTIIIAWLDNSTDEIEIKGLDTASDTLTGLCNQGLDQGDIDTTTFMVTVAAVSTTEAVVAYSDTNGDTEVDIFDVTAISDGTCSGGTFTDVSPGNITFGSGITGSDRPVVFALSSTKVGMVFQDGNLSYSELDVEADDWTTNNLTIASVADNIYSVTSNQAATPKIWILTANISDATDTNFYTCCTTDFATTEIDGDVGSAGQDNVSNVDMFCPSATNCKIVYTDNIDTATPDLVFLDCNDATCSSPTTTIITNDIGNAGDTAGASIYCVTDGDAVVSDNCKVVSGVILDAGGPDLRFYDCINDEDCSTNVEGVIDTDVGGDTTVLHTAIYCPADDDCKVIYNDAQSSDFDFVDCGNTACSSGNTVTTLDGTSGIQPKGDIDCSPGAADCKVVYQDESATGGCVDVGAACMVDCGSATCTSVILGTIDADAGATTGQVPLAVDCVGGASDCKVIYGDQLNSDFDFVDCGNTACSSTTITTVDSTGGASASNDPTVSMDCIAADDCKVVYVGDTTSTSENLYILDCNAVACTTGSVIEIGSSSRFGAAIDCPAGDSNDCKIVYYGGGSGGTPTLVFLDCDVTNCFPSVTHNDSEDPWATGGGDAGNNIETVTLTYRSDNTSLYASVIMDASDQAYYKSTSVGSIAWTPTGTGTSWGFTAGALNEISSPERISAEAQMSVVLNRTDANGNFEFANVPENVIYLALLAPFTFRLLARRRREAKVMRL